MVPIVPVSASNSRFFLFSTLDDLRGGIGDSGALLLERCGGDGGNGGDGPSNVESCDDDVFAIRESIGDVSIGGNILRARNMRRPEVLASEDGANGSVSCWRGEVDGGAVVPKDDSVGDVCALRGGISIGLKLLELGCGDDGGLGWVNGESVPSLSLLPERGRPLFPSLMALVSEAWLYVSRASYKRPVADTRTISDCHLNAFTMPPCFLQGIHSTLYLIVSGKKKATGTRTGMYEI